MIVMNSFDKYSDVYDLIYHNKDYRSELDHFLSLLEFESDQPNILEVGCGTGNYTRYLMDFTKNLVPFELSPQMAKIAERKNGLKVIIGDISEKKTFDLKFDACLMLFHVINYITENNKLEAAINNISESLRKGGYFLFDSWHTPAVYTLKPKKRSLKVTKNSLSIVRKSTPSVNILRNIIKVNFQCVITDKEKPHNARQYNEVHEMRPYSIPELKLVLDKYGFITERITKNFSKKTPDITDWSICIVCRKR